jgi:hypothetical protein
MRQGGGLRWAKGLSQAGTWGPVLEELPCFHSIPSGFNSIAEIRDVNT